MIMGVGRQLFLEAWEGFCLWRSDVWATRATRARERITCLRIRIANDRRRGK